MEELQSHVGISFERFEEQFKTLLIAVEVGQYNLWKKNNRELSRLTWTVNYEGKGGSSSHGRHKGRAVAVDK